MVLDATVVSNFASTDSITFLVELVESPVVVPAVRDELERGRDAGHDYLATAVETFGDELAIRDVPPDAGVSALRERLDAGEAESIRCALAHGGTLATDDLAAREAAGDCDLPVTGSVGLLVLGVERGQIDGETADDWLDTWRERRGYYAPVQSVDEVRRDDG